MSFKGEIAKPVLDVFKEVLGDKQVFVYNQKIRAWQLDGIHGYQLIFKMRSEHEFHFKIQRWNRDNELQVLKSYKTRPCHTVFFVNLTVEHFRKHLKKV